MVLSPKERKSSWGSPGFAVLGPGPEEDWLPALPPSSCPPTQPMSIRPWNASPAPHLPANIGLMWFDGRSHPLLHEALRESPPPWWCSLCPTQKLKESARSQETRLGTRQSEILVSKRVQSLGLSHRTSEMDMTLAMNFRVDTGDPQRRGEVTGWQAPRGHNKSHKLMAQNHTPSPPPSIPVSRGQVWASCSSGGSRENPLLAFFSF